jgi:putative DNA methylase
LAAFGVYRPRGGKAYAATPPESVNLYPADEELDEYIDRRLSMLRGKLPSSKLPRWSGIVNPSLYGIESHADLLNKRQTASCLTLIQGLDEQFANLCKAHGRDVALFVVGVLSAFIDQIIDWNSRLSMWIPQNEQVGRALCGPGISMLWDYAETDPFVEGPANLWDKLKRIVSAVESVPIFENVPEISVGSAQDLDLPDNSVDAIVTDPPYYDNIFYNILSDCIYSWKRLLFSEKHPTLFGADKTSEDDELVSSKVRQGSSVAAHEWYCAELTKALSEFARVLKNDGIISFVYGHSSLLGWEAIVRGFKASGLHIETVEPLSIERRQRPRAMTSDAVNTCIVIVARKRLHALTTTSMDEFRRLFLSRTSGLAENLIKAGWLEADVGMALFANAVGILATCSSVAGVKDLDILRQMALEIQTGLPSFEMQTRGSI